MSRGAYQGPCLTPLIPGEGTWVTHKGLSLWTEEVRVKHLRAGFHLGSELESTQGQRSEVGFWAQPRVRVPVWGQKPCCPEPSHCHPRAPPSGSPTPALTSPAAMAAQFPLLPGIHAVLQVSVTLQAEGHQMTWPLGLDRAIRGLGSKVSPSPYLCAGGQGLGTLCQPQIVARSQVTAQEEWGATAA